MTSEQVLIWIAVGLISGWLAAAVVGGGMGLVGDIVIGIIGAFLGGAVFHSLGWAAPFPGLAGVIAVAFVGSLILLVILRLLNRGARRKL